MKVVQWIGLVVLLNGCLFTDSTVENNGAPQSNIIENNGESTCGNGEIDAGEQCDSKNLNGADCNSEMQGTFGDLSCNNQCEFDLDSCVPIPATCGDGTFDKEIEECDGTELGGVTCETEVGAGSLGTLGCSPTCTLDRSGCGASCGNSTIEEGEECEEGMIELGCAALVGTGSTGNVSCNACGYDISGCTQVYKQISAGGLHTCALKFDNTVRCWGAGDQEPIMADRHHRQSISPLTKFKIISAGGWHNCGIELDGSLSCWGRRHGNATIPQGAYDQISAGVFHSCARSSQSVTCWGIDANSSGVGNTGGIADVGTGRDRTCYLKDGAVSCTTVRQTEHTSVGKYTSIGAGGGSFMCGIPSQTGTNYCWGEAVENGMITHDIQPTMGGFASIDAGRFHACGLRGEHVSCWGRRDSYENLPANVEFSSISVGDFHACGLTKDGEARCWGDTGRDFGQMDVPVTPDRLTD